MFSVYGGSSVFDIAAPEEKDWPHQVQGLLREKGFSQVEVINAGIPGHATLDCLGRFLTEGHLFQPDYVVLYSSWNDVKFFGETKPLLRVLTPFDQKADPLLNYRNTLDRFLGEHSQLYVRLRYRYFLWKLGDKVGMEGLSRKDRRSQITAEGLRQYEVILKTFVDLVRNAGAEPILMTEARLVARPHTEAQEKRIGYEYQKLVPAALWEALDKADQILSDVAQSKNVLLIDASKEMTGKEIFFLDHVHLTPEGSRELAKRTAQAMLEQFEKNPTGMPHADL